MVALCRGMLDSAVNTLSEDKNQVFYASVDLYLVRMCYTIQYSQSKAASMLI